MWEEKWRKHANYLKCNGLHRQEQWGLYGITFKGDRKDEGGSNSMKCVCNNNK
jgi:hypothetical protein